MRVQDIGEPSTVVNQRQGSVQGPWRLCQLQGALAQHKQSRAWRRAKRAESICRQGLGKHCTCCSTRSDSGCTATISYPAGRGAPGASAAAATAASSTASVSRDSCCTCGRGLAHISAELLEAVLAELATALRSHFAKHSHFTLWKQLICKLKCPGAQLLRRCIQVLQLLYLRQNVCRHTPRH